MSKAENINSLKQLKERQQELKQEVALSKRALSSSVSSNREQLSDFLLKKVALPVGIAVAGFYLLHRATKSSPQSELPPAPIQQNNQRPTRISSPRKKRDFTKLITMGKLAIPAAQAIMAVMNEEKKK